MPKPRSRPSTGLRTGKAAAVRVGLVGCGEHARANLCPAFSTLDGVRLVACCDVDEARAKATARQFGFRRLYQDYERMLAEEDLTAVVVSLPHHRLAEAAQAS